MNPIVLLLMLLARPAGVSSPAANDTLIVNHVYAAAYEHALITRPMGAIVAFIGERFLGSPYEAGTLDPPSASGEQLIANVHSFDCVTFVENVLALSRCVASNSMSFDAYRSELQRIRYRHGNRTGYTSRLHYFTDWIADNGEKKILTDVTRSLGGIPYDKRIDFMTSHRSRYPRLASDSVSEAIARIEDTLSAGRRFFIPSASVTGIQSGIRDGDIIAFTSSVPGLDISHTGLAIHRQDGIVHLLHAPDVGQSVTVTEAPLAGYLRAHPRMTGIVVLRPIKPSN